MSILGLEPTSARHILLVPARPTSGWNFTTRQIRDICGPAMGWGPQDGNLKSPARRLSEIMLVEGTRACSCQGGRVPGGLARGAIAVQARRNNEHESPLLDCEDICGEKGSIFRDSVQNLSRAPRR